MIRHHMNYVCTFFHNYLARSYCTFNMSYLPFVEFIPAILNKMLKLSGEGGCLRIAITLAIFDHITPFSIVIKKKKNR